MQDRPADIGDAITAFTSCKAHNPPWLIGIANLWMNGNGFFAAMPFILRRQGLSIPEIATITSITLLPSFTFFLWTPIIEIGLTRRQWFISLLSLCAGLQFLAMMQNVHTHLILFMVFLFFANICLFGAIGINGPMVRDTVAEHRRGEAGGWIYAMNIISSGSAGIFIWIAEHAPPWVLEISIPAMALIPISAMWFAHENYHSEHEELLPKLRAIRNDLLAGLGYRSIWEGLVIFVSPMSAAVLIFIFSGITIDYHVTGQIAAILSAFGWTAAGAIGAIFGGKIINRLGPLLAYPVAGISVGLSTLVMLLCALNPITYTIGTIVYYALAGFCGASAVSLMIQLTADAGNASSTWFSALWAAGNLPWIYMEWLDGQGYKHYGPRGMLGVDMLGNALPALLFLLYLRTRRNARIKPIQTALMIEEI